MLKLLFVTSLALLVPSPAEPRQEKDIVVAVRLPTLSQWIKRVSTNLDDVLRYPSQMHFGRLQAGMATVRFETDDTGKTANIVLYRKSNSRHYDLEAVQAVGRMKSVFPLPLRTAARQHYQANIIFAASQGEYEDVMIAMKRDLRERQARFNPEKGVIALSTNPRTSSRRAS